jgi:hypothetical protein
MNNTLKENIVVINQFAFNQELEMKILLASVQCINTYTPEDKTKFHELEKKFKKMMNEVDPLIDEMKGSYLDKAEAILHQATNRDLNPHYAKPELPKQ